METWLEQAQKLEIGRKRKIVHCGRTPSMTLENTIKGWRAYCHRCKESFFEGRSSLLRAEEIQQVNQNLRKRMHCGSGLTVTLPQDFQTEYVEHSMIASLWMTWVARGGISAALRTAYNLGYSPSLKKAILPIYKTNQLVGVVYRDLVGIGPKYIIQHISPATATYTCVPTSIPHLLSNDGSSNMIDCQYDCIIVEDALSAIRVGQFLPTGSLLGTSSGSGKLESILRLSKKAQPRVGLWLDPDNAGNAGTEKLMKDMTLFGLEYGKLSSPKDPKLLSDRDIVRHITHDRYNFIADYEVPREVLPT